MMSSYKRNGGVKSCLRAEVPQKAEPPVQITRIMLVDDHTLFRKGLRALLETVDDYVVVGEASDGNEAIALAHEVRPDIILMDIDMPHKDGLEATDTIIQELPDTRVMILTVSDYDDQVFDAIKKGASGYLLKNLQPEELFQMLKLVKDGEVAINGSIAARILGEFRSRLKNEDVQVEQEEERLSEREIEVLQYLAEGYANKEIAEALFITASTVKAHLSNIMAKLHLRNRIECAVYAITEGLVSPGSKR